jgi:hypothetical protein
MQRLDALHQKILAEEKGPGREAMLQIIEQIYQAIGLQAPQRVREKPPPATLGPQPVKKRGKPGL